MVEFNDYGGTVFIIRMIHLHSLSPLKRTTLTSVSIPAVYFHLHVCVEAYLRMTGSKFVIENIICRHLNYSAAYSHVYKHGIFIYSHTYWYLQK